jgi:hypothetical protein
MANFRGTFRDALFAVVFAVSAVTAAAFMLEAWKALARPSLSGIVL